MTSTFTRRAALGGIASAAVLALAACGGASDPLTTGSAAAGGASSAAAAGSVVVGSANFPESELLMHIYAGALKAKGVTATTKPNIGARDTYLPALQKGEINVMPEYSGMVATYFDKTVAATSADEVYAALQKALPAELVALDKSAAQDKDSVVVTKDTAAKYSLKTIADLAPHAAEMVLGGPPEWKVRHTGVPGLKEVYGLSFKEFKPLDVGGPLTVAALKSGQIQAGNLFSTDPNVAANGFVVLDDPKSLYAAQNIVPLVTKAQATDTVKGALNAVSAKLDTTTLTGLVKRVVIDHEDADAVAADWLKTSGLTS